MRFPLVMLVTIAAPTLAAATASAQSPNNASQCCAVRVAQGEECPVGSGAHCGDDLPYCCYAPRADLYYCAKNIGGCTKQ
jgi:hypothetical protein